MNQATDSVEARWAENAAAQRARFADYALKPDHIITLEPFDGTVRVRWGDTVIAESTRAVLLHEPKHQPVFYIPPDDVTSAALERTDLATHCPYKGDARYWSLVEGDRTAQNAVWAYDAPIADVSGIKGLMAFYLDSMGKDFGLTIETD